MRPAHVIFASLVIVAIFAAGCSNGAARLSYARDLQIVQAAQPDRNPLLIIVYKDETPSRYTNGVPEIAPSDFEPILVLLDRAGGDLAIGRIRDRSNTPFGHCHFFEPPIPSAQLPEKKGNVFGREKQARKYVQSLHEDALRVAEWQQINAKALADCRDTLAQALSHHIDAPGTDVAGALSRAQLLFREPQESWMMPPQKYLVMVTDGLGNVSGPAPEKLEKTKILLVNSAGTLGSLEKYQPLRFENINSAFRFLDTDSAHITQPEGGQ